MIFKSSAVAIVVSGLLAGNASAFINDISDTKSTNFQQQEQSNNVFLIHLKLNSVVDHIVDNEAVNKNEILAAVTELQNKFIAEIKTLDPNARVIKQVKIVNNFIYVSLSEYAYQQLKNHSLVESIAPSEIDFINQSPMANKLANELTDSQYPFLKVNDAKGNPVVALIGQGVDYTHSRLGGEGTWDNFVEAYENNSNPWSGFPNGVVIGGFDFAPDAVSVDYNPLEFHIDVDDSYIASLGTMSASLILDAAPNAKLLAYKVVGATTGSVYPEVHERVHMAIDFAMDPNVDGDMSDAADVVLIDNLRSLFSYYKETDTAFDIHNVDVALLRQLSALGTLVVMPSGDYGEVNQYFNIPGRANMPEGLAVGYVNKVDSKYIINEKSPVGPTRGLQLIKPDIVAVNDSVYGAIAGTASGFDRMDGNRILAAAKVAGTAANIISNYPNLTPHEVKALIVNSGHIQVENDQGVVQIGGGVLTPLAANKSYALMYRKDNLQPSVSFGLVDAEQTKTFAAEVVIKNLTDSTQVYRSNKLYDDNVDNRAISVNFPADVILAPNSEISVSLSITVDVEQLEKNPITKGSDFTLENWKKLSHSGYVELQHDSVPGASIRIPWLIMPIRSDVFEVQDYRQSYTYNELAFYSNRGEEQEYPPHDVDWLNKLEEEFRAVRIVHEVENTSSVEQRLMAMPNIYLAPPQTTQEITNEGIIIRSVAGGLYPEETCESGEKLSLAITLWNKLSVPVSKHSDRIGPMLFAVNLYPKSALEAASYNSLLLDGTPESDSFTQMQIDLNSEFQLTSNFLDYTNGFKGVSRSTSTELETYVSPNNKTVVSSVCTDAIIHHAITLDAFNEDIGVQFVTDRQSLPTINVEAMYHNFRLGSRIYTTETVEDFDYLNLQCEAGTFKDNQGNCLADSVNDEEMYLYEYLNLPEGSFIPVCYDVGSVSQCVIANEYMLSNISFLGPLDSEMPNGPGKLLCDINIDLRIASCIPENLQIEQGQDESKWRKSLGDIDLLSFLAQPQSEEVVTRSLMTGTQVRLANIGNNDDVIEEELSWQNDIMVQPGERVRISTLMDETCAGGIGENESRCSIGSVIFSPESNFFKIASAYAEAPNVKTGQVFSVPENAELGYVIGKIKLESLLLQISANTDFLLIESGEQYPFQLSKDGVLSVVDPTELDFEKTRVFTLKVQTRSGNFFRKTVEVKVNVSNTNDTSPIQVSSIDMLLLTTDREMTPVDISEHFADVDGGGFVFSSTQLPQGLTLSQQGEISGMPISSGEYLVNISIFDGVNEYIASVNISIQEEVSSKTTNDSSGGSLSTLLIFLMFAVSIRLIFAINDNDSVVRGKSCE